MPGTIPTAKMVLPMDVDPVTGRVKRVRNRSPEMKLSGEKPVKARRRTDASLTAHLREMMQPKADAGASAEAPADADMKDVSKGADDTSPQTGAPTPQLCRDLLSEFGRLSEGSEATPAGFPPQHSSVQPCAVPCFDKLKAPPRPSNVTKARTARIRSPQRTTKTTTAVFARLSTVVSRASTGVARRQVQKSAPPRKSAPAAPAVTAPFTAPAAAPAVPAGDVASTPGRAITEEPTKDLPNEKKAAPEAAAAAAADTKPAKPAKEVVRKATQEVDDAPKVDVPVTAAPVPKEEKAKPRHTRQVRPPRQTQTRAPRESTRAPTVAARVNSRRSVAAKHVPTVAAVAAIPDAPALQGRQTVPATPLDDSFSSTAAPGCGKKWKPVYCKASLHSDRAKEVNKAWREAAQRSRSQVSQGSAVREVKAKPALNLPRWNF